MQFCLRVSCNKRQLNWSYLLDLQFYHVMQTGFECLLQTRGVMEVIKTCKWRLKLCFTQIRFWVVWKLYKNQKSKTNVWLRRNEYNGIWLQEVDSKVCPVRKTWTRVVRRPGSTGDELDLTRILSYLDPPSSFTKFKTATFTLCVKHLVATF